MQELTFSECKAINDCYEWNGGLRGFFDELDARPAWIGDVDVFDIMAINQGGCSSGAYMPAVIYCEALHTMYVHGDDVMEYIEQEIGTMNVPSGLSWSGLAVFYLSAAVELWAKQFSCIDLG